MNKKNGVCRSLLIHVLCIAGVLTLSSCDETSDGVSGVKDDTVESTQKAALSVALVEAQEKVVWDRLLASGTVYPWQLATIAAETSGVRVVEVLAFVGDEVKKGQLLARLDDTSIKIELQMSRAVLAEVEALAAQTRQSLVRAEQLAKSNAISKENLLEYRTAAKANEAKVAQAKAEIEGLELRLSYTRIVAPDDGVITYSNASVGTLSDSIGVMYKLIRQNRIEWRAELRPEQVAKVEIGQDVALRDPLGQVVMGTVRQIAPTADPELRTTLVYVDVKPNKVLKSGVYVSGEFLLAERTALTVPPSAVVVRDGFSYLIKVGENNVVQPVKVELSTRRDSFIEVVSGIKTGDEVVASGGAFLYSGDRVKVVNKKLFTVENKVAQEKES